MIAGSEDVLRRKRIRASPKAIVQDGEGGAVAQSWEDGILEDADV
jgi:hypothetical protein